MELKIDVSDAAYVDKVTSDSIMYELLEDTLPAVSTRPSWLTSACVRQSEQLEVLHRHLCRKHPHLLFPSFPITSRKSPGWGTDAHLQSMRRRLERYFGRLLGREELQDELALHDFMTERETVKKDSRKSSLWEGLSLSRWFSKGDTVMRVPEDRIAIYKPEHVSLPEQAQLQESLDKVIKVRQNALESVALSLDSTVEAIQRYNIAMGQVSKSIQDVTSAHVRHLVTDSDVSDRSSFTRTFQDDMRSTERRFRELGDRFVDLSNQIQPGFQRMRKVLTESVLEVSAGQMSELDNVRQYVNKEIYALRRYDEQVGRRQHAVTRRRSIVDAHLEARLNAAVEEETSEEEALRQEFETKERHLGEEMQVYWEQSSEEFFSAVTQSMRIGWEVSRVNVDTLKAWFPPTDV
ncbi:hypothetical protein PSACC_01925 [Paramicrosporidium saccamoebae]|uniref:PX domain-containing protein n=1 Tax=Paramicrosporidium saccamoebae TaxID=1246581 RepID=A0A2H9TKI3_9FUNG|nr:hypothetical protein PSACC_01925 [Paramicrosporidium saccamoebae]